MIYFSNGCVAIQILYVIVAPCDHETDVDTCLNLPMFRHECIFSDMNVFIEQVCNYTQFCHAVRDWQSTSCTSTMMLLKPTRLEKCRLPKTASGCVLKLKTRKSPRSAW